MGSKGKTNKQKESIEAKYKLDEMIGEGGNAKVFAVIPLNVGIPEQGRPVIPA